MTYGLTPQGFNPKSATQILAEINAAQRANPALGADFDNSPDSAVGQINAAFAAQIGEGWAALASVYASRKPRAAAAAGLDATVDAAAAILGLRRRNAVKGTVDITLRLAAGARVPAGVVIAVEGDPTNRWVTREAASNTSGGTVARTVAAEAETAGLFTADARTITSIATPMAGLLGASNDDDAFEGAPAEGSTILAGRIAAALDGSPLVRALYKVPRVRTVAVDENAGDSATTGFYGLPAHSFRAYVVGGDDQAVAEAIASCTAPGIESQGDVVREVDGRPVRFSRPAEVELFARVTLEVDPETYAGDAAVRREIAALDNDLRMGVAPPRSSIVLAAVRVAGVIDCTEVLMGRSAESLGPTNAPVQPRELARIGPSRITVVARGF